MNAALNNRIRLLLCLAFCFLLPTIAMADGTSAEIGPSDSQNAPDGFLQTIEECRKNLTRLRKEISASRQATGAVPRILTAELELWERFEMLTLQRNSVQEDIERVQGDLREIRNREAEREPPQSFLAVDALRDLLESEKQQLYSLRLEWQAEKRIILGVKEQFEEAEQIRRRSENQFDVSEPSERVALNRQRMLSRLQSRVLESETQLHREQAALMSMRIESLEATVTNLEGLIQIYASRFSLTQEELDQRLKLIDDMENQVRQQLAEADARLHTSMQDRSLGAANWSTTAYEVAREESQLFQRLLAGVGEFKDCWRRRHALSNGQASTSDITRWLEECEQTRQRVSQIVEQLKHRTQQRRETLSQINRSALTDQSAANVADIERQSAELHRLIDVYGSIQSLAASGERLCQRLIEDLKAKENRFSLSEYKQLAFDSLLAAWEYELTTIDDEPITVRKLVFGFILLLGGYYISRFLASALAYRVSPRFGVSPAGAAVLRSVLFYLLITAFGFISLEIVNVPLTVFAFLGGAVAIGVGFGSQNLINNFISGLILLVERPIRIGDLVNVDGIDANVEHIGARSTRVRTGANLEILVPNSKFLENNVTNWTLSDTRTRTCISVGVAYGSPVREVVEILHHVIRHHDKALDSPEPIVLFQDFADSSLVFEVHFWINMKRMMDGAKIRSEVRIAIDDAFRDAGIVIAFPQRDIHLDMSAPIEVRLSEPNQQGMLRRRAA